MNTSPFCDDEVSTEAGQVQFNLYGQTGEDFINTTKPQVVLAFTLNSTMNVDSYSSSSVVPGFTFSDSPDNPSPPVPRADAFIMTTHYAVPSGSSVIPLYRMRFRGPNGNNQSNSDWTLVTESEIFSFRSEGYDMDGKEGYVYAPCTPEPGCRPQGSVNLWRAYNSSSDDHATFPQSKYYSMTTLLGYSQAITKLGYAYPNQDTDGDGLVNGLEYVIGTNPSDTDTDNDGSSDSVEYPLAGLPQSDPDV